MDRLKVIGPYKGWSGYDRHTRSFVRELLRAGLEVQLTHLPGWSIDLPPGKREGELFDALQKPVDADTVLHFTMPNHASPEDGLCNVNYTMFEADRIPRDWTSRAGDHDAIVVPTESSRQAWVNSGVEEAKVYVSPLGIDGRFFSRKVEPLPLPDVRGRPLSSYRMRFLNIAELRPRKNHLALLRTWLRATRPDDDAVLIVKTTFFQSCLPEQFKHDLDAMLSRERLSLESGAPILFLTAVLSEDEIRALYHSATYYLSMSHGEGWDQVMMEAIASGLRPIAPRHSAYTHYLTDADTEFIPAELVPVRFEGRAGAEDAIHFRGVHWWQPDEDAAVATIRRLVAGAGEPKPPPQPRILRNYSWAVATRRLIEVLRKVRASHRNGGQP